MPEPEPIFSPYCDGCCDICLIAASDGGVRLALSTSMVAGQVNGRSLRRLIGLGSGLKTAEIQASIGESVGSCGRQCLLPGVQVGHGGAPPERVIGRCCSSVGSKLGDCSRRRFLGGARRGSRSLRLCELGRRGEWALRELTMG